jgi:hypothetical protein
LFTSYAPFLRTWLFTTCLTSGQNIASCPDGLRKVNKLSLYKKFVENFFQNKFLDFYFHKISISMKIIDYWWIIKHISSIISFLSLVPWQNVSVCRADSCAHEQGCPGIAPTVRNNGLKKSLYAGKFSESVHHPECGCNVSSYQFHVGNNL